MIKTDRAATPIVSTQISNIHKRDSKMETGHLKEPIIRIFVRNVLEIKTGRSDLNPPSESSHRKEVFKADKAV